MEFSTQDEIIEELGLIKHIEGGYYTETYRSTEECQTTRSHWLDGVRCHATSIYYMQTSGQPVGDPNKNLSPIIHCYSGGAPSLHRFLHADGGVEEHILGPVVSKGQRPHVVCPGNTWKIDSMLECQECSYSLWSEVVFPGWEVADHEIMKFEEFFKTFPQFEHLRAAVTA